LARPSALGIGIGIAYGCSSSSDDEHPPGASAGDAQAPGADGSTGAGSDAIGQDGGSSSDAAVGFDALAFGPFPPQLDAGFTPTFTTASFNQHKCTTAQVDAILGCLVGPNPDDAACNLILGDKANAACFGCLWAKGPTFSPGPLVAFPKNAIELNVGGCIANAQGNTSASGCGAKVAFATACKHAVCPLSDACVAANPSFYAACTQAAEATVCASFVNDAKCADGLAGTGGTLATCLAKGTLLDVSSAIGKLFCL